MMHDGLKVVPDSFLGGSAPRLESLELRHIPFPGLPKLLLSATHLRHLQLNNIPHSGYFPPDAIVTALSTLINLDYLGLEFRSPRSYPDQASRRPPPSTRSVLPVLTSFWFKGVSEYLEDLVACIDVPRLKKLDITFFNDIVFNMPQLIQFISRTPMSKVLEAADIDLRYHAAGVYFSLMISLPAPPKGHLRVDISCQGLELQLSSLMQVCTSCLPPLPMLEDLYFYEEPRLGSKDNIDNEQWLELLRAFSAVKNLYLFKNASPHIALALQELVEGRTTEMLPTVLPALQNIFVEGLESSGPVHEGIGQFFAARQVAAHPIVVSRWELDKY